MWKDGGGCHKRLRDTPTLGELCMMLLRMSAHELNVSLYLLRKFKLSPGSKLPASPNDASPPGFGGAPEQQVSDTERVPTSRTS